MISYPAIYLEKARHLGRLFSRRSFTSLSPERYHAPIPTHQNNACNCLHHLIWERNLLTSLPGHDSHNLVLHTSYEPLWASPLRATRIARHWRHFSPQLSRHTPRSFPQQQQMISPWSSRSENRKCCGDRLWEARWERWTSRWKNHQLLFMTPHLLAAVRRLSWGWSSSRRTLT